MNKVFIINGSGGSGKDLFVTLFSKYNLCKTLNISTVDTIKDAMEILGIPNVKDDRYRKFASDLKDLCTNSYDTPFKYVTSEVINSHKNNSHSFGFIHCREPKEIERLKQFFNKTGIKCETILIKRKLDHIPDNHADQCVSNYDYDHIIENYGTVDDFNKKVYVFYNQKVCEFFNHEFYEGVNDEEDLPSAKDILDGLTYIQKLAATSFAFNNYDRLCFNPETYCELVDSGMKISNMYSESVEED